MDEKQLYLFIGAGSHIILWLSYKKLKNPAYNNNPIRYVDPLGNVAKPRMRTLGGGGGGLGSYYRSYDALQRT